MQRFYVCRALGREAVCFSVFSTHTSGLGTGSKARRYGTAPRAEKAVLVMGNLNTHTLPSLYEAFPAAEAFETAQRLEIHYTPKHGGWLNIAETELSAMSSQCLNRRIETVEKLNRELEAWQQERNRNQKTVKRQFTTKDARIKLHGLYPSI
jgi:hypothetical protein